GLSWRPMTRLFFLPDRAAHKSLAWVEIGLLLIVRRFLAGGNPLAVKRGTRSLPVQARKILRDRALGRAVLKQLPIERENETLAIERVAETEGLAITVVGDAWRDFKNQPRPH